MGKGKIDKFLREYKKKSSRIYREYLQKKIVEASQYSDEIGVGVKQFARIAEGGKRLRGALVVLGYMLGGGRADARIVKTSLFAEVFHAGLLALDDVIDRDQSRRGERTIHTLYEPERYGEAVAILVSDLTFTWAMELILESGFERERVILAMRVYRKYFERVVYGETLDVVGSFSDGKLSEDVVMKVMKNKTAEYTGVMPLLAGLALAGVSDKKLVGEVEEFGTNLGWAFQVKDDILAIFGKDIGKRVGNDLSEKKQTLLMLNFWKVAGVRERKVMEQVWGKEEIGEFELEEVRRVLRDNGSLRYATRVGQECIKKCREVLLRLPEGEAREILGDLAHYIMEREN